MSATIQTPPTLSRASVVSSRPALRENLRASGPAPLSRQARPTSTARKEPAISGTPGGDLSSFRTRPPSGLRRTAKVKSLGLERMVTLRVRATALTQLLFGPINDHRIRVNGRTKFDRAKFHLFWAKSVPDNPNVSFGDFVTLYDVELPRAGEPGDLVEIDLFGGWWLWEIVGSRIKPTDAGSFFDTVPLDVTMSYPGGGTITERMGIARPPGTGVDAEIPGPNGLDFVSFAAPPAPDRDWPTLRHYLSAPRVGIYRPYLRFRIPDPPK